MNVTVKVSLVFLSVIPRYKVWPNNDLSIGIPPCPICGLKRPLIFQVNASLEHSPFHRTLYIFTCIQATCSNQSKSWLCIRVQQLEKVSDKDTANIRQNIVPSINWCSDANDWGEPDDVYNSDADNCNEQNGNIIKNDNRLAECGMKNSVAMVLLTMCFLLLLLFSKTGSRMMTTRVIPWRAIQYQPLEIFKWTIRMPIVELKVKLICSLNRKYTSPSLSSQYKQLKTTAHKIE